MPYMIYGYLEMFLCWAVRDLLRKDEKSVMTLPNILDNKINYWASKSFWERVY